MLNPQSPDCRLLLATYLIAIVLVLSLATLRTQAQALPSFDFKQATTAREWGRPHDIKSLRATPEGLEIELGGSDPYFFGPARNFPTNTPLWLRARLRSDEAGSMEVFYFRDGPRAGTSVRADVPGGRWTDIRVALPPLGPGYRLRIDPPGMSGRTVLASVDFEQRIVLPEPQWPAWVPPPPAPEKLLAAGPLELWASPRNTNTPFGLDVRIAGQSMARAHPRPRVAYLRSEKSTEIRWLDLAPGGARVESRTPGQWIITDRARDPDGAEWVYQQSIRIDSPGAFSVETSVRVNAERAVLFLPLHLWIAGEGSFGAQKGQGLLAGLEYLEDEPSSSEADIIGPESNRRVPAAHKITFPLMAIQAGNRYVGLIWDNPTEQAALFDSPDRTFGSGGHVMGVIHPGVDGARREEGNLFPQFPRLLKPGESVVSKAWIIGGSGADVTAAVQHYLKLRGWPSRPEPGFQAADYVSLAARSWLHSKIRDDNLYRHAFWPGFNPQPAADAAAWETWLARQNANATTAAELLTAAGNALAAVPTNSYYHAAVGHVRAPIAPLVFGAVPAAIESARRSGRAQLGRFSTNGSVLYRPSRGGPDYGRTHREPEANGLTAQVVAALLEAAAFSGDRELVRQGIDKLRALEKFRHGVPRGAQTWEVPLHTPDILAAAHLVRAYTLGYELSGERQFLERAIEWAWTGVPFVYLRNPTGQPIGPYSTIAVLGATSWKAPVWFGRPVQWCGLVYADSLSWLARHDAGGPWQQLADGIVGAGLQHSWGTDDPDRVGLLPDFFELIPQTRAGPAINPATLGSGATRFFGLDPWYDFRSLRRSGLLIHAPGAITVATDSEHAVEFTVKAWPEKSCYVVMNRLSAKPVVKINGGLVEVPFEESDGRVLLPVRGTTRVELSW